MGQVGNVFDVLHGYDINVFVLGVGRLHSFWDYKTLWIGIGHWTFEGFELSILAKFCFLVHVDGDLGIALRREFLEFEDIRGYILLK